MRAVALAEIERTAGTSDATTHGEVKWENVSSLVTFTEQLPT